MPNLLETGSNWLQDQRKKHSSRQVTYRRDTDSVVVSATVGRTVFEQDDGAGVIVRTEVRDYLIDAIDLVLGGLAVLPNAGDRILEDVATEEIVDRQFGALNKGALAVDSQSGIGYLLMSFEDIQTRLGANVNQAEKFVVVSWNGTAWEWHNNDTLEPFFPLPSDLLVAELDFDADTATLLSGTSDVIHDINSGYLSGDLVVSPNMWGGVFNPGEFGLAGTSIKAIGASRFTYEVMSIGNEPHWRYSDPYRKTLRIHTKHIATEEI